MSEFFTKVILFFILVFSLHADDGLSQAHLISIIPEPSAIEVALDGSIEVQFDLPIVSKSIKNKTITIRDENNKKIKGTTTLKDETALVFTPNEVLTIGTYKVKVKKVKLQDFTIPTKGYKKYAYKACAYLYDDVKDCPLCKYLCSIKTKKISFTFFADDTKPKLISLTLNKTDMELNIDKQTDINVTATYDDNTSLDITNDIEWIMSNNSVVSILNNTISPLSEGTTSLQAKYNKITSTKVQVTVFKEINGYKLPPEPDETLNNSTLLGIDINDNGVRDDVERKVIETYVEPIKIEPMMASVKIGQEILENPVGLAKEHSDKMDRVGNCMTYIRRSIPNLIDRLEYVKFYEKTMYNTKARVRAYLDYNLALSGGVYGSSPSDWNQDACDFDVEQMLKDMK
ncbi:MAG: hypothetical protein COB17_01050 [Sulfurimonas sp.]|nr:MAG: hypothetical protein COB17_01050 [Sulfurimonas sp.]